MKFILNLYQKTLKRKIQRVRGSSSFFEMWQRALIGMTETSNIQSKGTETIFQVVFFSSIVTIAFI